MPPRPPPSSTSSTTTTTTTPTPLRILFLHGYTQNGALFRAKTRALEKHLQKTLSPRYSLHVSYPTGPLTLSPSDIPGYEVSTSSGLQPPGGDDPPEAHGWWRRSNTADPPEYFGLEDGLAAISRELGSSAGPFDGVIGFSQGACAAVMVASLLERRRRPPGSPNRQGRVEAFRRFREEEQREREGGGGDGAPLGIPYPESFAGLEHPPLKFVVQYSGFRAPGPRYRGFYEDPPVETPVLHFLGSLDSVVEEARTLALVEACAGGGNGDGGGGGERVVYHPGGHFLPSQRVFLDRVAAFVKECVEADGEGEEEEMVKKDVNGAGEEENVEDMDVPF